MGYPYGALWAIVPDVDGLAGDVLTQRYRDTRTVLGFLPTGSGQTSIFWSVRSRDLEAALSRGAAAWREEARSLAGRLAPLVDAVEDDQLLAARYRDVVVRTPVRVNGTAGLVLLGDAAHAMSPQLGLGANLALADAWTLACSIAEHPRDLPAALDRYADSRRAHIRWYTWCSRLMTPVFQSGLVPVAWPRDLLFEPARPDPVGAAPVRDDVARPAHLAPDDVVAAGATRERVGGTRRSAAGSPRQGGAGGRVGTARAARMTRQPRTATGLARANPQPTTIARDWSRMNGGRNPAILESGSTSGCSRMPSFSSMNARRACVRLQSSRLSLASSARSDASARA